MTLKCVCCLFVALCPPSSPWLCTGSPPVWLDSATTSSFDLPPSSKSSESRRGDRTRRTETWWQPSSASTSNSTTNSTTKWWYCTCTHGVLQACTQSQWLMLSSAGPVRGAEGWNSGIYFLPQGLSVRLFLKAEEMFADRWFTDPEMERLICQCCSCASDHRWEIFMSVCPVSSSSCCSAGWLTITGRIFVTSAYFLFRSFPLNKKNWN